MIVFQKSYFEFFLKSYDDLKSHSFNMSSQGGTEGKGNTPDGLQKVGQKYY